jgi:hypothetical protein
MTMPSSISLADARPTPVSHVFSPIQDGPEAKFANAVGSTIISSQETLAVEVVRPKTDAAQQTARVVIWDPVEGTVDGQAVVLRGLSATASFKFPPGSTLAEKEDIVKMMANALLNADIKSAIANGTPFI